MAPANDTMSLEDQIAANTETLKNGLASGTSQVGGFATAFNARTRAAGAAEAASDAVEAATTASGKITTQAPGVAGDSAVAEANAQAVLDNRDAANAAVTTARNAKQSAESALGGVTDATLMAALEEAIKVADDNLKAATMSAESDALKTAVELVTGADPEAEGYPMMPAQHGKAVAMAIGGALMPTERYPDGARSEGTHTGDRIRIPEAMMFPDAVNMNNHQGSALGPRSSVQAISLRCVIAGPGTDDTEPRWTQRRFADHDHYGCSISYLAGRHLTGSGNTYADGAQHDRPQQLQGHSGLRYSALAEAIALWWKMGDWQIRPRL